MALCNEFCFLLGVELGGKHNEKKKFVVEYENVFLFFVLVLLCVLLVIMRQILSEFLFNACLWKIMGCLI